MQLHAISLPHRARRLSALFAAALVVAFAGSVGALTTIDQAGVVEEPAERIITTGEGLLFPIDPVPKCVVADNFGGDSKYRGSGGHQGVDIAGEQGQEVYAVEDGFLYRQFSGAGSGLGWGLWSVTDVKYRYFHLDAFADGLEVGDTVTKGQLIGYVGDTGNAVEGGDHLHFEVRPGPHPRFGSTTPVDPFPLLDIPSICTIYRP